MKTSCFVYLFKFCVISLLFKFSLFPRMKSATQDRYWPDRIGSRTGGSGANQPNGLEKVWFEPSVWPMAILVCSAWSIPIFRPVRSGQYLYFWSVRSHQYHYFVLFGLVNTHILFCSVWSIPIFWFVRSSQYPGFCITQDPLFLYDHEFVHYLRNPSTIYSQSERIT